MIALLDVAGVALPWLLLGGVAATVAVDFARSRGGES